MIFKLKKLTMKEFGASGNHGVRAVRRVVLGRDLEKEIATKTEN